MYIALSVYKVYISADSTHHFFRTACTKSGALRFSPKHSSRYHWFSSFLISSYHLIRNQTLLNIVSIRVITKLPNSEQSYKGKVKTHNYINRQSCIICCLEWSCSIDAKHWTLLFDSYAKFICERHSGEETDEVKYYTLLF
jgi:hypothetical protein